MVKSGSGISCSGTTYTFLKPSSEKDYHTVKTMGKEDALGKGLYQVIGKEIDDKYMDYTRGGYGWQ